MQKPVPDWFLRGRLLTVSDLQLLDAAEFIEDEEWDHSWRLCELFLDELPIPAFADNREEQERLESIRGWISTVGFESALKRRPIVAVLTPRGILEVLDGYHRIAIARELTRLTITATVGCANS